MWRVVTGSGILGAPSLGLKPKDIGGGGSAKKEGSRLCGRIFGVLTGQGGLQVRLEGSFPPKETGSGRKNRFKFHAFRW